MDTRYWFVNEFVEDGYIEIIFLNTKDNVPDILTKNSSVGIRNLNHHKMFKDIENRKEGCWKVFNLIYGQRKDELTDKKNRQPNRQREQTKNIQI